MADRSSPRRWPPGSGLALGLAVGVALGAALGNLIDRTALGMVFGLVLGLVAGLLIDDPRGPEGSAGADGDAPDGRGDGPDGPHDGTGPHDGGGSESGTISRALLWLVGGLVVLFLLAAAIAPELLAAPGEITATLGVVLLAGVPGALVLLALVARRRRIDRHEHTQEQE